jgi:hypothetical protein
MRGKGEKATSNNSFVFYSLCNIDFIGATKPRRFNDKKDK